MAHLSIAIIGYFRICGIYIIGRMVYSHYKWLLMVLIYTIHGYLITNN